MGLNSCTFQESLGALPGSMAGQIILNCDKEGRHSNERVTML